MARADSRRPQRVQPHSKGDHPDGGSPVLRLVNCEQQRIDTEREKTIEALRWLLYEANRGNVSRLIAVFDNGPETTSKIFCSLTSGQRKTQATVLEAVGLVQQVAHRLVCISLGEQES